MTTAPTLTGQDIGQAAIATRAVFDLLLAKAETSFHQWVVLSLLDTPEPGLAREELTSRFVTSQKLRPDVEEAAIRELEAAGLVAASDSNPDNLELTSSGRERVREIRAGIARVTERLYGDLPREDAVTARRVLVAVTERANAELARSLPPSGEA